MKLNRISDLSVTTVTQVVFGERRRTVLLFLPLAFSLVFFLLMTEGLGLYLAPGAWMID